MHQMNTVYARQQLLHRLQARIGRARIKGIKEKDQGIGAGRQVQRQLIGNQPDRLLDQHLVLTLQPLVVRARLPGQQRHQQQRRHRKHHHAEVGRHDSVRALYPCRRQPVFFVVIQGSHFSGRNRSACCTLQTGSERGSGFALKRQLG